MSSMTGSPRSLVAETLEPLRAKSGWIVALGVVYVIAGIIALGSVVTATKVSVFVVGIMMVIAGVAEIVNAFQIKTWGKFLLWLFLGAALIVSGVTRIILAFGMQAAMPWVLVLVSGVITLLLGLIIVAHWPVASLYVLGIFLGVDLVLAGASWIGIGLGLRRLI